MNLPKNVSLEEPQQSGLHGSRNFKVQYFDKEENSEVTLGAWHILPSQLVKTFGREMSLESVSYIDLEYMRNVLQDTIL